MKVGVPTEIKTDEYRVAMTPAGVRDLTDIGHEVYIQAGAGLGSAISDEDYVGTEARGLAVNPGTFTFRDTGFWAGGPILRNKLFVFGNYENEKASQPLHTFVANTGGQIENITFHKCGGLRDGSERGVLALLRGQHTVHKPCRNKRSKR